MVLVCRLLNAENRRWMVLIQLRDADYAKLEVGFRTSRLREKILLSSDIWSFIKLTEKHWDTSFRRPFRAIRLSRGLSGIIKHWTIQLLFSWIAGRISNKTHRLCCYLYSAFYLPSQYLCVWAQSDKNLTKVAHGDKFTWEKATFWTTTTSTIWWLPNSVRSSTHRSG